MGRPKKIKEPVITPDINTIPVDITSTDISGTTVNPAITVTSGDVPRKAFFYPIPETREDLLALHKCLKDLGVNSTSDLEVRASRM